MADDATGVGETDEQGLAGSDCCASLPASGGSCCDNTVESAVSTPQSACCGASAKQPKRSPSRAPAAAPRRRGRPSTATVPPPTSRARSRRPPGISASVPRDRTQRSLGAWRVRWGFGSNDYRVKPVLYGLGTPDAAAPVLVTANYKLTFDALRSRRWLDAWLLVETRAASTSGARPARAGSRRGDRSRSSRDASCRDGITGGWCCRNSRRRESPPTRSRRPAAFVPSSGGARRRPARLRGPGMKADPQMRAVTFDARERAVLTPAELQVASSRRMMLAYAGILAVSAIGHDGVSLRRAARRGGPVIAGTCLPCSRVAPQRRSPCPGCRAAPSRRKVLWREELRRWPLRRCFAAGSRRPQSSLCWRACLPSPPMPP